MSTSAVLTKRIKQLLHKEISDHFANDPIFRNKLKVVNQKSDLENFTYGVMFRNVSANKTRFSPHNYVGPIYSYVSIAKVGNHPSAFINLVEEDELHRFRVIREDVSSKIDGKSNKIDLHFDPIMQSRSTGEIYPCTDPKVLKVIHNGERIPALNIKDRTVFLHVVPQEGDTLTISYAVRNIVPGGYYFLEITDQVNTEEYGVYVGNFEAVEREPLSFDIPAVKIYLKDELEEIQLLIDGQEVETGFEFSSIGRYILFTKFPIGTQLSIYHEGTPLTFGVDCFYREVVEEVLIETALGEEDTFVLPWTDYEEIKFFHNEMPLHDYKLVHNVLSLEGPLNFGSTLRAKLIRNNQEQKNSVLIDDLFAFTASYRMPEGIHPGFIEVYQNGIILPKEAYDADFTTGVLRFIDLPGISSKLEITYRISNGTTGPFTVKREDLRNDILPGVKIYFGNRFEVGDKVVVIVGKNRKNCADEYGGRWELNVELATIADDPIESEDLIDKLAMFLEAELKPHWDAAGLFISEVQVGGESGEEKDESTSDTNFQNSVSLTVSGEWIYRIPRKFRLLSLSYAQERETKDWEISGSYLPFFQDGRVSMMFGGERP